MVVGHGHKEWWLVTDAHGGEVLLCVKTWLGVDASGDKLWYADRYIWLPSGKLYNTVFCVGDSPVEALDGVRSGATARAEVLKVLTEEEAAAMRAELMLVAL